MQTTLSFWDLLLQANFFVQFIMLTLMAVSILVWAIFLFTMHKLHIHKQELKSLTHFVRNKENLESLYTIAQKRNTLNATVFKSLFDLWQRFHKQPQYVLQTIYTCIEEASAPIGTLIPWLTIVAHSAPFVGLLGTVWGIMNSFQSIAATQETHLGVVAPGIAEALAATALGLLAAIPASILSGYLNNKVQEYQEQLGYLSIKCINILKQQKID